MSTVLSCLSLQLVSITLLILLALVLQELSQVGRALQVRKCMYEHVC